MADMQPRRLSQAGWKEIMTLPLVNDMWSLQEDTTLKGFSSLVYAVKFHFFSGSPGYVGDLFILQGDHLTGTPPLVLVRDGHGKLIAN